MLYSAVPCRTRHLYNSKMVYSHTSLIRASLIRILHNPNTVPGNLFYHLQWFSNPHVSQSEPTCSDKRGPAVHVYLEQEYT